MYRCGSGPERDKSLDKGLRAGIIEFASTWLNSGDRADPGVRASGIEFAFNFGGTIE